MTTLSGSLNTDVRIGQRVEIVLKKDQRTGVLTEGIILRKLTKAPKHTQGIKVLLESGEVGRVKNILQDT